MNGSCKQHLMNKTITTYLVFLFHSVFGGFNDLTTIYCKHSPRNFTPSLIGYFFAEVLFVKGVGVVLGIPLMSRFLKLSDLTIAMIGVASSVIFYIVIGSASSKWMVFVGRLSVVSVSCSECFSLAYFDDLGDFTVKSQNKTKLLSLGKEATY